MTEQLVHRDTERLVRVRYNVEAVVECTAKVRDSEVREYHQLEADEEVTFAHIEEFVVEQNDESMWDLCDITHWEKVDGVDILGEEARMVAPPTFVPLPGMDEVTP